MEPKWLKLAREELGVAEVTGAKSNPRVIEYFADAGHPEVRSDETAWCCGFVSAMLHRSGLPTTGSLAARSYLNYGKKLTEPKLGCIVVFSRGNSSWEGHVAFFISETATTIRVLGGNQNNRVSIASYPKSKLLGYRWPVEPTVEALAEAGSSEIAEATTAQKVAIATGGVTAVGKAAEETGAIDQLKDVGQDLGVVKHAMEGFHAVAKFAVTNLWVVALVGSVAVYLIYRKRIKQRVARHLAGHPIFGKLGS